MAKKFNLHHMTKNFMRSKKFKVLLEKKREKMARKMRTKRETEAKLRSKPIFNLSACSVFMRRAMFQSMSLATLHNLNGSSKSLFAELKQPLVSRMNEKCKVLTNAVHDARWDNFIKWFKLQRAAVARWTIHSFRKIYLKKSRDILKKKRRIHVIRINLMINVIAPTMDFVDANQ